MHCCRKETLGMVDGNMIACLSKIAMAMNQLMHCNELAALSATQQYSEDSMNKVVWKWDCGVMNWSWWHQKPQSYETCIGGIHVWLGALDSAQTVATYIEIFQCIRLHLCKRMKMVIVCKRGEQESALTESHFIAVSTSSSLTYSRRCIIAWASDIRMMLSRCLTAIGIPWLTADSRLNSV